MFAFPTSARRYDVSAPVARPIKIVLSQDAMDAAMYFLYSGGDMDSRITEYNAAKLQGVDLNDKFNVPVEDEDEVEDSVDEPLTLEQFEDEPVVESSSNTFNNNYDCIDAVLPVQASNNDNDDSEEEIMPDVEFERSVKKSSSPGILSENDTEVSLVTQNYELMKVLIEYPTDEDEKLVVKRVSPLVPLESRSQYIYNVLYQDKIRSIYFDPVRNRIALMNDLNTGVTQNLGWKSVRNRNIKNWGDKIDKYDEFPYHDYFCDEMDIDGLRFSVKFKIDKFLKYYREHKIRGYCFKSWFRLFILIENPTIFEMLYNFGQNVIKVDEIDSDQVDEISYH